MSIYTATVIKTGNSYALRVPKAYIDDTQLTIGQKVQVGQPIVVANKPNLAAIRHAIRNLQQVGAYRDIADPVAWQRSLRQDRPVPGRE